MKFRVAMGGYRSLAAGARRRRCILPWFVGAGALFLGVAAASCRGDGGTGQTVVSGVNVSMPAPVTVVTTVGGTVMTVVTGP